MADTIPFSQKQTIPFSAPKKSAADSIWLDLAKGAVKGFGSTVKSLGEQAAQVAPQMIGGPLTNVPPIKTAIQSVTDPAREAIQTSVGLTDENLAASNTTQSVGKGLEIGAEILTGIGGARAIQKSAATLKGITEAVSPKLTPGVTEKALSQGKGTVSKFMKEVTVDFSSDPHVKRITDAVMQNVAEFDPSKPLVHNINATRQTVYKLADDLKQAVTQSGKDVIYPFKELASDLRAIDRPTSLTRDLEPVYDRVQAKLLEIAKQNGGKLSDLFEARKEFDQFVEKALPNLYDKQFTPMRIAVTDMRRAVNEFIASHLPKDIGFHDSLTTQSRLFEAIDNMAEKAASGPAKEVGTNAVARYLKKHPTAKRILTDLGLIGAGAVGINAILD